MEQTKCSTCGCDNTIRHSGEYPIGKPFWVMIEEEKQWRAIATSERIKELEESKELINIELEALRPSPPRQTPTSPTTYPPFFENSIAGFHNPKRHKGMSATAFIDLYKARLRKSNKGFHGRILDYLTKNPEEGIIFVRSRFSNTFSR